MNEVSNRHLVHLKGFSSDRVHKNRLDTTHMGFLTHMAADLPEDAFSSQTSIRNDVCGTGQLLTRTVMHTWK